MKKYSIYINHYTLLITDVTPKSSEKFEQLESDGFDFLSFYKSIKKAKYESFVLVTKEPKAIFKQVKKKLTIIKAAGGLVENDRGEFLFIFRNKKWDLPKGKVEKGEKVKETSVREVEEECGVVIQKRGDLLCKTYHIYELGNKIILKRTSWYKMRVKGVPSLVPQTEEGITNAVWVSPSGVAEKIQNTYPLILDVLKAERLIS